MVTTEIVWPTKPETCTVWPSTQDEGPPLLGERGVDSRASRDGGPPGKASAVGLSLGLCLNQGPTRPVRPGGVPPSNSGSHRHQHGGHGAGRKRLEVITLLTPRAGPSASLGRMRESLSREGTSLATMYVRTQERAPTRCWGGGSPWLLIPVKPPPRPEAPHLAPGSVEPPPPFPALRRPSPGPRPWTDAGPPSGRPPGSIPAHRGQRQTGVSSASPTNNPLSTDGRLCLPTTRADDGHGPFPPIPHPGLGTLLHTALQGPLLPVGQASAKEGTPAHRPLLAHPHSQPRPQGPAILPSRSEPQPCRVEKPVLAKCRFLSPAVPMGPFPGTLHNRPPNRPPAIKF